jgi:hypothetical protein
VRCDITCIASCRASELRDQTATKENHSIDWSLGVIEGDRAAAIRGVRDQAHYGRSQDRNGLSHIAGKRSRQAGRRAASLACVNRRDFHCDSAHISCSKISRARTVTKVAFTTMIGWQTKSGRRGRDFFHLVLRGLLVIHPYSMWHGPTAAAVPGSSFAFLHGRCWGPALCGGVSEASSPCYGEFCYYSRPFGGRSRCWCG